MHSLNIQSLRNEINLPPLGVLLVFTNNSYHKPTWLINNQAHYAGLTRIFRITSLQHCAKEEKKKLGIILPFYIPATHSICIHGHFQLNATKR